MLEPRARTVEPEVLMEQLFKLSELETRISVNMNVLVDGVTPRVVSLSEALQQWLDHRRDVLLRRSRHRLAAIERRLELLAGMMIVYLNLDEVIRIVREEDEPKPALIARFALNDNQANYILDTRLRSLRRLEEMQLRKEQTDLTEEKTQIEALLASDRKQWQVIAHEIRDTKKKYGPETKLGKRRTSFEAPPDVDVDLAESLIEREPITVLVSRKGWIRAMKGHVADLSAATFKGDDGLQTSFFAETTSKMLVLASDGKAFTLDAAKLPGGRSLGEPLRLMADIDEARLDRRRLALCRRREDADRGERRARLRRAAGRSDLLDPQGPRVLGVEAPAVAASPSRRRATTSPSSARTASCWCFRSARSRKWRAARACVCNATRTAACRMRACSRSRKA